MLASGENAKAINQGTITSTNIKHGIGIVGINKAKIENSGSITVKGTGDTNNIGVYLKNSGGTIGTPATGITQGVEVSGDNSIGVLAANSDLTMAGNVKVSGNSVLGILLDKRGDTANNTSYIYW